jgi:DNA-binding MurR/RpiR family transcriptional regulator
VADAVNPGGPDAWARIVAQLKEALPDLKPMYRKIALGVLEDPQTVSFSSIQSLARELGVNEAAIVRFAKSLGYRGFADFKRTVQEAIRLQLNPYGAVSMGELTALADARQMQKLVGFETDNVRRTLQGIKLGTVTRMIEGMRSAGTLYAVGFGATRFIVELYAFLLASNLWRPVPTLTGAVSDYVARLNLVREGDALLVASLPPYSREDRQIARFAKERRAKVYLFTDSPRCPVYPLSDEVLLASSTSLLYTNSYTGLIASFKVLMDMWLLANQKEAAARMKALTEIEREGYQDLAAMSE